MKSLVDEAIESYRIAMDEVGEEIILRRQVEAPPADPVDVPCRARVVGFQPQELVGGINQGDRKIIILAEDVDDAEFELPFETGGRDTIVVRDAVLNIKQVDDSTRRIAGTLIAYEIVATG